MDKENKVWYHVSHKYLGTNPILLPRVPLRRYDDEGNIPHICVSDSIFKCLRAIYGEQTFTLSNFLWILTGNVKLKNKRVNNFVIYKTKQRPYTPPSVRDFKFNNEKWFVIPTEFELCGFLDSKEFIYNDNITFTNKRSMGLTLKLENKKDFNYCFKEENISCRKE